MNDLKYFVNLIKKIKEMNESIEWLGGYDQKEDWIIDALKSKREELEQLHNLLMTYCCFTSKNLTTFIKDTLERIERCKYEIVEDGQNIIIRAIDNKDKRPLVFKCIEDLEGQIYLNILDLDFLNEDSDAIKAYPYLKDIILNLVEYQARNVEFKMKLDEKDVFFYIRELIAIKYGHLIDDGYDISESLKEVAERLLIDIIEDKTDYISGVTHEERKAFYGTLIKGEYNTVADKNYWFAGGIDENILSKWHNLRQRQESLGLGCSDISRENYIVFNELMNVYTHIQYIKKNGSYYISLNGHTQTPATQTEESKFEELIKEVLGYNYNWREAREVVRNVSRLGVFTNYKFPHNIDQVCEAFKPKVVTFYDKYNNVNLKGDLSLIQERALQWAREINETRFSQLFQMPNRDGIDEYLKRMILSQFDIPKLVHDNGGDFHEQLEIVKKDLETSSTLSPETCQILFSNGENNKELCSLAIGVLVSLGKKEHIEDILAMCKENQKYLGCKRGIVGYSDMNTLCLPNGDRISSLYCEDIRPYYDRLQSIYNFYSKSDNDLEYIEGCVEIFGDVLMTQIFRVGNKRTAKCLFNELLVSRGIIPPIMDLNENERELWDELADGRFDRYPQVKKRLLQDTITIREQIGNKDCQLPTTVSLDALNRSEFKTYRYHY